MKILLNILILFFVCSTIVFAQTKTDRDKGIEFYKQGNYDEAILALKNEEDVTALFYLGSSYEKLNSPKDAKKSFEKSFKKSYEFFEREFAERQKLHVNDRKESFSEFLLRILPTVSIGITSAEKAYQFKSGIFQLDEWRLKVTTLLEVTTLAKTVDELKQPIYSSTDNSTSKAKIKEKPRAHYTEQALGKTEGTVRLLVVFGADGQIKAILPVKELKNGLTYEAIKAARQIKFEPATKDGKPVMSYALVEYSFSTKIT